MENTANPDSNRKAAVGDWQKIGLVDVSVSMVEEREGGPQGFARVKQRVEQVIDSLAEGSLFNVIVFADAGHMASAGADESFFRGFGDVSTRTIKSDWGIGIGSRDGMMRLGFAWKTDIGEPVKVFVRLSRPF